MKIGDRVFVRGYIDEIRKDTVIIRNAGGYFGTIPSEVITGALPPAQPDPNCSEIPNNSDTISRQAAIDMWKEDFKGFVNSLDILRDDYKGIMEYIDEVPSAQPYALDEWCDTCKEYDSERHCCPRFNHVIRTTLNEVEPMRKRGKWIIHETENDRYDDMICPFCKKCYTVDAYRIDDIGFTAEDFNFCPNCGADMRGGQDG